MRFALAIAALHLSFFTIAQNRLDSLANSLDQAKSDSLKFQLLFTLSKEAEYYDYVKARKYAEEGEKLAEKIDRTWAKGPMYLRMAFLETMEGDYADALQYDLQCVKLYTELKDTTRISSALIDVGTDYRDLGEYQESYLYLTRGYQLAKKHSAISHSDSLHMAIALHNIGTIFTELDQFDIAMAHFDAASKISEAIGDLEGEPYTFDELGDLYRRKKEFAKSEESLIRAMQLARQLKITALLTRIQSHFASLYREKGDFQKSLLYYDSLASLCGKVGNRFGLAECDLGRGIVKARSGDFAGAQTLFLKTLDATKELNARSLMMQCYGELSNLYEARRDFEKSLHYQRRFDALRDSLFSESAMAKLFQDQVRFETANKDTEIAALSELRQQQNSELKKQELVRNIMVIVAALSIILLFSVYRSGQRRKRINELLLEHQEEIKKRSIELEQLNQVKDKFFSIISHDLRSPMNALSGTLNLLEERNISPEEFADLTKNLRTQFNHTRTLINNLLDWTLLQMDKLKIQPEKVTLHDTVEESFQALHSLYPKKMIMENKIDKKILGYGDRNMLSLVLRNLILNAIKFTETGGHIWVDASVNGKDITISVSDNGIGIKPEVKEILFEKTSGYSTRGTANEKGTGLGLILCKEFVEKNGGKIWLESEVGKGTTFYFTVPKA